MSGACDAGSGSARRRRERRLRSWLRHERMTVRMELTAALHHSAFRGAGPETYDAPRSQKTVNSKREAELFSLFEEDLGGTRPDRLSDVRPQERVQRHTVEHLTDLVRSAPKVQVLDAPAPLVVEQLADVLALVEKKEREEDARMDQLENMILEGKSASAADKEAWQRWARAGGTKRKRKKRRKRKLPRTSLRPAARVPAVQARDHGGAPVPVHRPSAWHSSCTQRQVGSVHTVQVCGDFTGAAFGQVVVLPVLEQDRSMVQTVQISVEIPHAQFLAMVDVPVVVQRQVLWSKQCRTLFGSSRLQLQFLDKVVVMLVIVQRQVLGETQCRKLWRFRSCSLGSSIPGQGC